MGSITIRVLVAVAGACVGLAGLDDTSSLLRRAGPEVAPGGERNGLPESAPSVAAARAIAASIARNSATLMFPFSNSACSASWALGGTAGAATGAIARSSASWIASHSAGERFPLPNSSRIFRDADAAVANSSCSLFLRARSRAAAPSEKGSSRGDLRSASSNAARTRI